VPGTLAVAFNCTPERALPKVMSAGLLHVMVGVAVLTVSVCVESLDVTNPAPALYTAWIV
jgi:hypothetical protein